MSASTKTRGRLATGLLFLGPSIIGFLYFTIVPLGLSFVLAFTNWDVRQHNMFKGETIEFVGWENFERLLSHPAFWQYLGNTLFFMMGIPVAIIGSLVAALLLTRDLSGAGSLRRMHVIAMGVLVTSLCVLQLVGFDFSGMGLMILLLFGSTLVAGVWGRSTVYRTLFYAPHFTARFATDQRLERVDMRDSFVIRKRTVHKVLRIGVVVVKKGREGGQRGMVWWCWRGLR